MNRVKKIIWGTLGATAILLIPGIAITNNICYSIISGCILGVWLAWTAIRLFE